jgi:hypothetical protein
MFICPKWGKQSPSNSKINTTTLLSGVEALTLLRNNGTKLPPMSEPLKMNRKKVLQLGS